MFTDVYVLAPERTAEIIARFLECFLPLREESADDYHVPEYSDNPVMVLKEADEVIQYAVENRLASQRIYWRRLGEGEPQHSHVFFLADGGLVLGVSVAEDRELRLVWWVQQLKECVGSQFGYYVGETPPVDSTEEFKSIAL